MASKGAYSLSDKVLVKMAQSHMEEAVTILRRFEDTDKVLPHIKEIRKVKSNLEDLQKQILMQRVS